MDEVKDFCEEYIQINYPTVKHFKEIDADCVTKDMMEYAIKSALLWKKLNEDSHWREIMSQKEHDVLLLYNQLKVRQIIKELKIPTHYGYYVENPANEFSLHKGLKDTFRLDLSYMSMENLSLILHPKGVIFGKMKPQGFTILHRLIMEHVERLHNEGSFDYCSCSLIKVLIDCGADITAKDHNGITPFNAAVKKLLVFSVEIMLSTGKISNDEIKSALLSITTDLPYSKIKNFEKCLKLLEAYGGDLNSIDQYGNSLLNRYLLLNWQQERSLSITKALVKNSRNWFQKNNFGLSPLHSCAVFPYNGISDIINYLCNFVNINIDERDNYSRSPLIHAVIQGSKNCCNTFLINGANINLKDKLGLSSMHYASMLHDSSVIKFLLNKSDADIHAKDHFGDIPLVYAAATGRIDIVSMLYPLHNANRALYNRLLSVADINDHSSVTRTIQMKEKLYNTIAAETKSFELSKRKYKKWLDEKIKVTAEEEKIKGNMSNLRRFYDLEKLRKTENKEIKNEVTELMTRIADLVRRRDEKLCFVPILSGSNAEDTKVGVLDEIDFLCNLEYLSSRLQVTLLESDVLPGYVNLRIENPQQADCTFLLQEINQEFYLSVNYVGSHFFDAFATAMSDIEIWKDLHLTWYNEYITGELISTIKLIWNGRNYKNQEISIDLVPTFLINKDVIQSPCLQIISEHLNIGDVLKQISLVAKRANDGFNERQDVLWRSSFSNVEAKILQMLPESARSGYKLVKFIREEKICPLQAMPKHYISSYLLKTCLLHVVVNETENGNTSLEGYDDKAWGSKILSRLQLYMETRGNVPHFFLEDVNLGTSDKEAVLAYCEIGKGWLEHPWKYCY